MKSTHKLVAAVLVALSLSMSAHAEQRPDHFQGKPAETLNAALANFSEYNEQLSALLAKRHLETADMAKVHELTYTLENALHKIRSEFDGLAETLEEVHVASERLDAGTVKARGRRYLEMASQIVRQP